MTRAPVGYSGKALIDKIGLKPGQTLAVINAPAHYRDLVEPLPEGAKLKKGFDAKAAVVHLFVGNAASLKREIKAIAKELAQGAMLWISWPKKSSKLFIDLTENDIRTIVLPTGLVDVKVSAVDEDWSGLKFLRRKK